MSAEFEAMERVIKAAIEIDDVLDEEENGGCYTREEHAAFELRGSDARLELGRAVAALYAARKDAPALSNGIHACPACDGDGFFYKRCGCREAACPHEPMLGDGTEPEPGLYMKFWVRRTDGSSRDGEKHADCEYFVLDWEHDKFAPAAALAYADACAAERPDLAADLRRRAAKAMQERGEA